MVLSKRRLRYCQESSPAGPNRKRTDSFPIYRVSHLGWESCVPFPSNLPWVSSVCCQFPFPVSSTRGIPCSVHILPFCRVSFSFFTVLSHRSFSATSLRLPKPIESLHLTPTCQRLCELLRGLPQMHNTCNSLTGTPILFTNESVPFWLDYKFSLKLGLYLMFLYFLEGSV